jgi:hypothetical protein
MEICPIPSVWLLRAELSVPCGDLAGSRQGTVLAEMRGTTACGFSTPTRRERAREAEQELDPDGS